VGSNGMRQTLEIVDLLTPELSYVSANHSSALVGVAIEILLIFFVDPRPSKFAL
jgi:hypothetical protein